MFGGLVKKKVRPGVFPRSYGSRSIQGLHLGSGGEATCVCEIRTRARSKRKVKAPMARSSSQSQSSVGSGAGAGAGRPATVGPRGTPAAAAGMRRRRASATGGGGGGGGFSGGGGSNMLRFYTDEAPGLRLSPTMVLVMSLCFIGFVTALHVFGKLYRSRAAAASA
ncbi:hypothetical protein GUJ93_ZPchr0008g13722 [Zizania palustris]|uniref:Protein transport protein Sec61 subunit beta n=1 Tax=Zizania palustris TaxID=103762 RepID=A0A8J5RJR1_ZIZPA|nr:hypothetical protein GUJ93_ZPchr0008g13722 [Zizania palustris]